MENVKHDGTGFGSKLKVWVISLVAVIFTSIWALAFTQSANAAVAIAAAAHPVAVAAHPVSVAHATPTVARSAPVVRSVAPVRSKPITHVTSPALIHSSSKNCNLEQNKKLKECLHKK